MNNVAASVRARLLNVAKTQGVDFNQVLVRFALERILYRLCQSEHADRFLLKGALLFTLWYDMPHRATRDADLLGFGASDLDSVAQTFRDIASVMVDDGIVFDPASVVAEEIRKDAGYAGARILISGELAKARCKTQIDIGFGDAVVPGPDDAEYPVSRTRTSKAGPARYRCRSAPGPRAAASGRTGSAAGSRPRARPVRS